jgi:SAM-dependent methyltransferase
MAGLDFDGDDGRHYTATIRRSIPAYDALLEIGTAAVATAAPAATSVLVVGPGPGEELPALIAALPKAKFTLLEPSSQMAQACIALLQQPLDASTQLDDAPFAVVICHHVVHLMPPDQQRLLLQQLAAHVAPGGVLLLSSLSEPTEPIAMEQVLAISRTRLALLGMEEQAIEQFMAGLNTVVFGLSVERLAAELTAAGLHPPQLLLQALGSHLWLSRAGTAP